MQGFAVVVVAVFVVVQLEQRAGFGGGLLRAGGLRRLGRRRGRVVIGAFGGGAAQDGDDGGDGIRAALAPFGHCVAFVVFGAGVKHQIGGRQVCESVAPKRSVGGAAVVDQGVDPVVVWQGAEDRGGGGVQLARALVAQGAAAARAAQRCAPDCIGGVVQLGGCRAVGPIAAGVAVAAGAGRRRGRVVVVGRDVGFGDVVGAADRLQPALVNGAVAVGAPERQPVQTGGGDCLLSVHHPARRLRDTGAQVAGDALDVGLRVRGGGVRLAFVVAKLIGAEQARGGLQLGQRFAQLLDGGGFVGIVGLDALDAGVGGAGATGGVLDRHRIGQAQVVDRLAGAGGLHRFGDDLGGGLGLGHRSAPGWRRGGVGVVPAALIE